MFQLHVCLYLPFCLLHLFSSQTYKMSCGAAYAQKKIHCNHKSTPKTTVISDVTNYKLSKTEIH